MNAPVVLEQSTSYRPAEVRESLRNVFTRLGGIKEFAKPGQYVLIKPNVIAGRREAQTHPVVVVELAKLVRDSGGRVAVGDSPAWGSMLGNARRSGLLELARSEDIPLFELKEPVKIENPTGKYYRHLTVSRQALEADAIINVPKLKTHQQLKLSAAVKNMFGVVPGKRKAYWHFKAGRWGDQRFANMIVETHLLLRPVLTIIDGIEAMEGPGPIRGRPRPVGALIASRDPFAAELAACELLHCDPKTLPIMQAAWQLGVAPEGFGRIEIVGADLTQLAIADFEFPEIMPIAFSLPRVVRSTLKQLWMRCTGRRPSR